MVLQELDIAAPSPLNLQDTLFPLSQGLLTTWDTCRRKFQLLYLEQLALANDPDQYLRLERGQQFHLLMQQEHLGLNIDALAASDQHLDHWWQQFQASPPAMIAGDRIAEHRRTLAQPPFLLTAIYDLLILGDRQAQIIDWKTYEHPPTAQHLQHHWQTRLYLYLLAETSAYPPPYPTHDLLVCRPRHRHHTSLQRRPASAQSPGVGAIPRSAARRHPQ
ncbi:MAG: PD-(D/E)XK nuclease family protein [Oscillatoriales cyanobacterium SM2_2_1]|nr:PD-(D/E)XK nuclease family protein [Oscillatoriales cyanobacterium SM2_2_1]